MIHKMDQISSIIKTLLILVRIKRETQTVEPLKNQKLIPDS